MRRIAESLPPYDLLKAYRDARAHFRTTDIVLVVVPDEFEGFVAQPRGAYIERAFLRWTDPQRAVHPLVQESAHQRLKLPLDRAAFWLAVESPEDESVGYCAIGALFRPSVPLGELS
jgi:hypothetical protein